jgi:hypothetical protein
MARSLADVPGPARPRLVAGIDWGGGVVSRTVLVIGYLLDDDHFNIVHMSRYQAQEEPQVVLRAVSERCNDFGIRLLAADGAGNGGVYNNLLLTKMPDLRALYAMLYSVSDQEPRQYKGRLWNWTIGRTPSIGMVFSRVKKKRIRFPRIEHSSSFLDEIWCEIAEYDDHHRTIKYTHSENQPDDALHAINYAAVLARILMTRQNEY